MKFSWLKHNPKILQINFLINQILMHRNKTFKICENAIDCWFTIGWCHKFVIFSQILISRDESAPFPSISNVNIMFLCN